jgi:hypothetical protein
LDCFPEPEASKSASFAVLFVDISRDRGEKTRDNERL